MEASIGSKGNGKLNVLIDGVELGQTQSLTTTSAEYTFFNTANLQGELTIRLTNTQKAMYVKSINIGFKAVTTDIEKIQAERPAAAKRIENGRLVITIDGKDYDITGRTIE